LLLGGHGCEGRSDEQKRDYLYRGIPAKGIKRQINLADYVQVKTAAFDNGLLRIELVRELPEAMKPPPYCDRWCRANHLQAGGLTPFLAQRIGAHGAASRTLVRATSGHRTRNPTGVERALRASHTSVIIEASSALAPCRPVMKSS
jgi:hypothetical protein